MDAPKRNPDTLNTIGIVTVGGVGSALVYLAIVSLQAFYVNDTSKVDEQARFGTQGDVRQTLRGEQIGNITETRAKGVIGASNTPVYSIPIEDAKRLVVRDAKVDPGNLVPVVGRSDKSLIQPAFGRPQPLAAPPAGVLPPAADPTATPPAPGTPAGAQPATGDAAAVPSAAGSSLASPPATVPGVPSAPAVPAAGDSGSTTVPNTGHAPAGHEGHH